MWSRRDGSTKTWSSSLRGSRSSLPATPAPRSRPLTRRMALIPFEQIIPEEKRDRLFPKTLKLPEVQSAILTWLVQGYLEFRANPVLTEPGAIRVATAQYRMENDSIGEWIAE